MRQISIDLTTDRMPSPTGTFIGYMGEHNATELLITIPQEMVDKSEYQIVVFQSRPLVFRSNRVTEDKSKTTYRDGNIIHVRLSKSLTRMQSLSLQVECYRENEDGEAELIGKTAVIPNLVLKPSPEGFPAYGFDGSFEDVDFAVLNAHCHDNLEVLKKFTVNEHGTLLFDGYAIGDSAIQKYPTPSELPTESKVGVIAYAENDDEPTPIGETKVRPNVLYERLRFRYDINPSIFDLIKDFVKRTDSDINMGTAAGSYAIAQTDETIMGAFQPLYTQALLSGMFVIPKPFYTTRALYGKDERLRNIENGAYFYSNTDIDIEGLTILKGWNFQTQKEGDFEFTSYGYKHTDVVDYYRIDSNDTLFTVYNNVGILRNCEIVDEELESEFLSAIFEVLPNPTKKKGLYIFTDTGWLPFEDYLRSNTRIVSTVADLPDDCPAGTLAHVIDDGFQLSLIPQTTISKSTVYNSLYFPPYPIDETFLFDFTLHATYVDNTSPSNRVTYNGFIDIESNLAEQYIIVTVSNGWNSTMYNTFIYALEDLELEENGTIYAIKKGWNKVIPLLNGDVYINHITDFSELPKTIRNANHDVNFGYLVTDLTINGPTAYSLPSYFILKNPVTNKDNGAGLWVKTEGEWKKIDNPEEFLMQEIDV